MSFLVVALSLIGTVVNAADSCHQAKREIGTKIEVTLATDDGKAQSLQFEVKNCRNGTFSAFEKSQNSTVLQYKAGQSEVRKITFTGSQSDPAQFRSKISATWNSRSGDVKFAAPAPGQCATGEHWDSAMKMCMPDQAPTDPSHQCGPGQVWDPAMNMCMAGSPKGITTMFHYNQFIVATSGSGPRGRTAITAPNMWMLMLDKKTSASNTVEVSWMGTTDLWTVPKNGTPELFQSGESNAAGVPFIDAQHPHSSPIMGLTFSDILSLAPDGSKKLTFFFAPRGEATAGPESYMHRPSAEGNPDVPLGHHLQDVFHISSTVVGVKMDIGKWSLEASTFSGREPSPSQVNLDMHKPDSYAARANYRANDNVTVGASYAKVTALDRANNPNQQAEDERAIAAWIQTSNMFRGGKLSTTTLWGQNDNRTTDVQLNSFLEEVLYELGKNDFYGRFEAVQRTPDQLEVQITDGKTGAKWIKAFTLGYERQLRARGDLKMYAGVAATTYSVPKDFAPTYGPRPVAAKAYLRIKFGQPMPR